MLINREQTGMDEEVRRAQRQAKCSQRASCLAAEKNSHQVTRRACRGLKGRAPRRALHNKLGFLSPSRRLGFLVMKY
jgi:hypothetical protein